VNQINHTRAHITSENDVLVFILFKYKHVSSM
jgi:hypothetical protein